MNWLLKLLFAVIGQLLNEIVKMFAGLLNDIFNKMYELQNSINISSTISTCRSIAISLVAVFALKHLICMYVLESEEIDEDSFSVITRLAETIATIKCGSFVIEKLIDFAAKMCDKFIKSFFEKENDDFITTLNEIISHVIADSTVTGFILIIFLATAVVVFIIVVLKAAKRGAELILFQMVLPFVALSLLGKNREMWNMFKNQIMITIFGYIIQLFGYLGFAKALGQYTGDNAFSSNNMYYLLAGMGWLFITLSAPKWLDKFVSQSGAGQMAKSSISSLGRVAMQMKMR